MGTAGVVHLIVVNACIHRMPISYYARSVLSFSSVWHWEFSLHTALSCGLGENTEEKRRAALIGAGSAGQMIFRDIKHAKDKWVYCFIDDNPNKWGRYIDDVPVFGEYHGSGSEVWISEKIYKMPFQAQKPEDVEKSSESAMRGYELMNLPGMYQLYGEVSVSKMKPVQIEDLEEIRLRRIWMKYSGISQESGSG